MRPLLLALLFALAAQARAQTLEPATPESQGMDSAALAQLVEYGANVKMDSLVVVRNGRLVAEVYYAPFARDMLHRVNSTTKAVVGTLAGIAIARGELPSSDSTVQDLLPAAAQQAADGRWQRVTLQHLLDMTSGMRWDEPLGDADFPSVREMERSPDWTRFILGRDFSQTPGLVFNYNSANPQLVSAMLSGRTGMSAEAYAGKHLFEALDIQAQRWRKDPQGVSLGGFGLYLRPVDMARYGVLYLQGGQWNGKQVVPRAWVERVFSPKVDMTIPGYRYADYWWSIPSRKAYFTSGFNGQVIMVLPELGVVAATTGRAYIPFHDLIAHLERAAKSATPLPGNAAAQAALAKAAAVAAAGRPMAARPAVQPVLKQGVWELQGNPYAIRELALDFSTPTPTYKVKLRTREFGGEIGMNGRFGRADDAGTPVFTRAAWKDASTLEVEQHWAEEAGQLFYEIRFDAEGIEFNHTNQFGVKGRVRGKAIVTPAP